MSLNELLGLFVGLCIVGGVIIGVFSFHRRYLRSMEDVAAASNAAITAVAKRHHLELTEHREHDALLRQYRPGDFLSGRGTIDGFAISLRVDDETLRTIDYTFIRSLSTVIIITAPANKQWPRLRLVRGRAPSGTPRDSRIDRLLPLVASLETDGREMRLFPRGTVKNPWYAVLYRVNVVGDAAVFEAVIAAALAIAEPR